MRQPTSCGVITSHSERLEPRRLLAAFTSLSAHGTLTVIGTGGTDDIDIAIVGGNVHVTRGAESEDHATASVKRIWVDAYQGNDSITNTVGLPTTIFGSEGDDTLRSSARSDSLDGGGGGDIADYSDRTSPLTITLMVDEVAATVGGGGGQDGETDHFANLETVIAGSAGDTLAIDQDFEDYFDAQQGSLSLRLDGGSGNDDMSVRAGVADVFIVYPELHGGDGNDSFSLWGQGSVTSVYGEDGDDTVSRVDDDYVNFGFDGGPGYDTYEDFGYGGSGLDPGIERLIVHDIGGYLINGNESDNDIIVYGGFATINAMGGNDHIVVYDAGGDSTILCGDGDDTVSINVVPTGGIPWHFFIDGGAGNDLIEGGTEDDQMRGGSGNNTLFGGEGQDWADFSDHTANLTIDLALRIASSSDGEKDFVSAENAAGGSGNDRLNGSPQNNILKGNGGNDTIHGLAGNDTLIGGRGRDKLFGGEDMDSFIAKDGLRDTLYGADELFEQIYADKDIDDLRNYTSDF